ncbi:MAG TPA: hypothetical protein PK156_08630 [Polyangium sp.]|nr:hypothetical protein [Polyangium sp.]
MIDITFLGQLVATLASGWAFLALVGVLGAAAYVLATAVVAIERLPGTGALVVAGQTKNAVQGRTGLSWALGTIAGLLAFVTALATMQVGGWLATFVFSAVLGALARSSVTLVSVLGARVGTRMARRRAARVQELVAWRQQKAVEREQNARKRLEGEDLASEVARAEAGLTKLRTALETLMSTRQALGEKLKAALDSGGNVSLVADMVRMRDTMDIRIDLGKRVLAAAEAAVARLAYALPVKKLVRRRPPEISGLDPRIPGDYAARIDTAMAAIDGYLVAMGQTRAEIDRLQRERPGIESANGAESLPVRARREIDALEAAYRAVRDRADLVRLGLRARQGMAQVANAAGEVSVGAAGQTQDRDAQLLIDDIARATQTTAEDFIGEDAHIKTLSAALARGTTALSGGDQASLGEVVDALQSMG